MHEIRIAEDLADIVLKAAKEEDLVTVEKVSISFGRLVQIVPELFETAFREAVRDTIAGESKLKIEIVEVSMKCKKCGKEFFPEEQVFKCKSCNSSDIEIIHGKEMFIESIEGEKSWK